jgi:uncharacterized membrane protein YkvA (DUF1232 family)
MKLTRKRGRKGGRKLAVVRMIRHLPNFLRLLVNLFRDARVSAVDKALLAFVIAYVVSPIDLVPDVLGFLGLSDDVFLLSLALNRLISNAGPEVLLEHWHGNPDTLALLVGGLEDAGSFVPAPVRSILRTRVRREG